MISICYTFYMYKYLIIGVSLMFISGGSYYINKAGGGLISEVVSGNTQTTITPLNLENIPGVYICGVTSGCENEYVLLLKNDKTVEMTSVSADNQIPFTTNTSDTSIKAGKETPVPDSKVSSGSDNMTATSTEVATDGTTTPNNETSSDPTSQVLSNVTSLEELPNNGSPSIVEKGTWDLGVQNMLVITLTEYGTTTYEVPQKLVIKNVEGNTLSKISYTKINYKDMVTPVFIKQE